MNHHPSVNLLFTIMRECPGMSSDTVHDAGSGAEGRLRGDALLARAAQALAVLVVGKLERRTRRLAFVAAAASVGDRLVARAQITKSVVPLD